MCIRDRYYLERLFHPERMTLQGHTDGVKGVTSNPSIFEKAIGSSDEYDGPIGHALKKGDRPVAELFEHLAVEDIQHAADVLRPVYDRLKGDDGFVSLEVSPYLAMDTKATIAEAERLWKDVKRKNLMVKVPATPAGLPAIQHLIGEGISCLLYTSRCV